MKKRLLAFLLALCIGCSMFSLPAFAGGSNAAVQTAVMLDGMTAEQAADPNAALTRGGLARLLVAFSSSRSSVSTQSTTGRLFSDVDSGSVYAPYIRIAVQQGWISGYSDGSFRPDNGVTLEEACTAALMLLGYDVTTLTGSYPSAQLNKAENLGLRKSLGAVQGQGLTLAEGAQILYNALTCTNSDGTVYGTALGFTVSNGQVDTSSVMLSNVKGPFIAVGGDQLPFTAATVYRNDQVGSSAELAAYDVYYYNETSRTVWIYTTRAAGRITAVSPSASAPTSVTVAGTEYQIASSSAAYQLSSLSGGGVGQVVTLLLGMNDEAVGVLTGEQANEVFFGVVQSSERTLTETNGADVKQTVAVACTDGAIHTVNVDKKFNYLAGQLVAVTVNPGGENIETLNTQSVSGYFDDQAMTLGDCKLADGVQILDTTSEGVAGTLSPSRLSGVTLSSLDVRYYTTNGKGEIDRLILNDVTGDLWEYGTLDEVQSLSIKAAEKLDEKFDEAIDEATGTTSSSTASLAASALATSSSATTKITVTSQTSGAQTVSDLKSIIVPSTSDILYSVIDGSVGNTLWENISGNTGELANYALQQIAVRTSGPISDIADWLSEGATYVCYVNGEQVTYNSAVKYPIVAGGIAVSKSTGGKVKNMIQLMPVKLDKLGAACAMSGDTMYGMADDMQVYLWYGGQYFSTTLSQINAEDYYLIGWYDNFGCTAGHKIRTLVAVKKS